MRHAWRLLLLGLSVVGSTSVGAAESRFEVTVTHNGQNPKADTVVFDGSHVQMAAIKAYGVDRLPVTTKVVAGRTRLDYTGGSRGLISFHGVIVDGARMDGSFVFRDDKLKNQTHTFKAK